MNIEKIPDPQDFPQLYGAYKEKKLVIFLGAGISAFWGCERWHTLANKIIDDIFADKDKKWSYRTCEMLKEKFAGNPRKLLTIAKEKSPALYESKMKEHLAFKKSHQDRYPLLFSNLRKLGSIFVTTNIDECFISEFKQEEQFHSADIHVDKLSHDKLFFLHGRLNDPQSWVMTLDEYVKHYQKPNVRDFMNSLFIDDYCLLFIGYGMADLEIIDYMIEKIDESKKRKLLDRLFIFMPFFQTDDQIKDAEQLYFDKIGMRIIPYAIDENGYSQIYNILTEWKEFMNAEQKSEFMNNLEFMEENL